MEKQNKKSNKSMSVIKAVLSGFIWGLGQLFNKQYLKALFFFLFFVIFISIELGTSKYFVKTDPYSKISGNDFGKGENYISNFIINYQHDRLDYNENTLPLSFKDFDELYYDKQESKYTLKTEQQLIDFIAADLKKYNPITYRNLLNDEKTIVEGEDAFLNERAYIPLDSTLYRDSNQVFYQERNYQDLLGEDVKDYVEVNFTTGVENLNNIVTSIAGYSKYVKTGTVYIINGEFYAQTKVDFTENPNDFVYMSLEDPTKAPLFSLPTGAKKVINQGPIYKVGNVYYEYIKPGLIYSSKRIQYKATDFTKFFAAYMNNIYNIPGANYTSNDYTRLMIKIQLAMNEEEKIAFEKDFNNFFYDKAGLFIRSYWGVFTLGTTKKIDFREYNSFNDALTMDGSTRFVTVDESYPIIGHVSTQVLLEGLIGVILSVFFLIFLVWSAVDAYTTSEKIRKQEQVKEGVEYFKEIYESSFEYIVLSPALFVLAFISIMPIVFGFLLAFTSISGKQSMIDTFNYVGFKNFVSLFNFADGFGASFGKAFWRVLIWTVIWAIFSTGTVFFGGLFQALIINSDRVRFKKFWRTILILPWAMPALLSQMVFSVMFGETGFINNVFRSVGLYDLFMKLGWMGRDFSMLRGIEKFFYIGRDNIQWFTNPFNPTFVKIILIVVNIWLGFPYFMALMSGIMTSIDKTLYEAADIDGATKGQKLRLITMPLILYSTAPILIMTFSGNFNNFGVIYFITGGGPNAGMYSRGFAGDTDILISWMYKLTVDESIYNIASVFSVLIFLFVGSITAWNLSRTRAFKED